jgi:HSP20 family molecular chaperone IbpA
MMNGRRISLEDLLITLSERLLSSVKSIRAGRTQGEPYVEVSETGSQVKLLAELNSVRPEDVRVLAGKNRIELIILERGFERFRGAYNTPAINPENVSMRFNNSILGITAERS